MLHELGGWPVLNDGFFDEESWSLEETEGNIKRIANGNGLFTQNIYPDPRSSENYIITVSLKNMNKANKNHRKRRSITISNFIGGVKYPVRTDRKILAILICQLSKAFLILVFYFSSVMCHWRHLKFEESVSVGSKHIFVQFRHQLTKSLD